MKQNNQGDILVADDQPENVRLLTDVLHTNGYKVRTVLSGNQALQVVESKPPELILLDIIMPDISGFEVCEKLKRNPVTQHIPVIFLSALSNPSDRVKAFEKGGVDYIIKPFFFAEVLCRIKTHITIYRQKRSLAMEIAKKEKIQAELEQASRTLERLANLDGLTEVANRRHFDRYLATEFLRLKREKLPLSLIMIDVDDFHSYNNLYGHLEGDDCLIKIVQTMKNVLKRPADLLVRYGGEEFAVILPNTPLNGAIEVAREIQEEISNLAIIHEDSMVSEYVTLSLGIASMIPTSELSPQNLIKKADVALFQAKKQGKNRCCY